MKNEEEAPKPAAPKIDLTPVESSQLAAVGYHPETNTLAIKFKHGGATYHYANFTPDDWAQFEAADSKGSHFLRTIKPNAAKWPFTRL